MEQVKFVLLILCAQTAAGFIWISSAASISVCVGNTISLTWDYTLESGESKSLTSWTKSDGAGGSIFLADDFGYFELAPIPIYRERLIRIGNAGIQISNAISSDIGTYTVIVTLTTGTEYRMNATVHVYETANASCIPTCDSSLKCQIPQACPVKNGIDAVWTVEGVKYPNGLQLSQDNYNKPYSVCAEGDAVKLCYSGPSLCHEDMHSIGTTRATTMAVTLPFWWLGRTLAEPAYITKASTGTNWIKNTISDTDVNVIVPAVVVPCGLLLIGAIVLVVFCVRRKARKNVGERPDGTSIQDKGNTIDGWKQSLGQGKVTDNLDTVYTTPDGFITHPGGAAISTTRSYKDNKYQNCQDVSRSHRDHNGRKQQRDYYSQYEMADYGGNGAGHRHTKQDTAFYY